MTLSLQFTNFLVSALTFCWRFWGVAWRSLEVLQLGHNGISGLSYLHLHRLKYSLKILFLQDNELTKIDGIESLVNLQELVLDRNKIKFVDTNSFSGLLHLQVSIIKP